MNEIGYEATLRLQAKPLLWPGEKVYVIVKGEEATFREPCPICDDSKKIVVRGREVNLPHLRFA